MLVVVISEVSFPLITSTNFIIGTGFIKCIPITLSILFVTEPILVIEIEEVLVPRIVFSSHISSSCLNIFSLTSIFSVAASITKSASFTASVKSVLVDILDRVLFLSSSDIFSLESNLSKFFVIVSIALSNESAEISTKFTEYPLCAKACAIPFPIVPAPITVIFFILVY